jgi:branched-chain amino acid transport system ATP-binding protein
VNGVPGTAVESDLLSLEGVWAGYGDTTVLRGVDIAVPAGSVVALLGPNGAGKTTVLRVASGSLRPTRGRVRAGEADATGRPPEWFVGRGHCHVPEGRGIFPSLTVRENLCLQAERGHEAEAVAMAAEAFPKLGQRQKQVAGTMSGGEQQMLAVARAYIRRPRLVLLDEVSFGLAPVVVDEIFAFLTRLARQGSALLLVEQFIDRALALADRVYLLQKGGITWTGAAADVEHADLLSQYLGHEHTR